MSLRHTSTKRSAKAAVYLQAARLLEDGDRGYCCYAINDALGIKDIFSESSEHYQSFKKVFGPKGNEENLGGWWGVGWIDKADSPTGARILALCFMAAMVEAGDA